MEVDSMLPGSQVVELEFEGDAGSLIPDKNISNGFSLSIFKFDFCLGCAAGWQSNQGEKQSEGEISKAFHDSTSWGSRLLAAEIISQIRAPFSAKGTANRLTCPQKCGVYCEEVPEILLGKSAIMALNAVEQVADQVPADDFQALEDKIYRTIEMYKAARQAQATAERDAQRLRQQMEDREEELVRLRREAVQLKKEREEIRGRVEKMLQQIETIAEAS